MTSPLTKAELVIMAVIVTILACILLPNYVRAKRAGHCVGCKTQMKTLGNAIVDYQEKNKKPPASVSDLPIQVPVCPAWLGDANSYSTGYQVSQDGSATLECHNHVHHHRLSIHDGVPNYESVKLQQPPKPFSFSWLLLVVTGSLE